MTTTQDREALVRETALDWHGGQFSALYGFGSSGVIVDLDHAEAIVAEARLCLSGASEQDTQDLADLIEWVMTYWNA